MPSRLTKEPSPPLRAVPDLPLKHEELAAPFKGEFDALRARFTLTEDSPDAWAPVYDDAIDLITRFIAHVDTSLDEALRDEMSLKDPNEMRRELGQEVRRKADQVLAEVGQEIEQTVRQWNDRAQRQHENILAENTLTAKRELVLMEVPRSDGLDLAIEPSWWPDYEDYISKCCEVWIERASAGIEKDIQSVLDDRSDSLHELSSDLPTLSKEITAQHTGSLTAVDLPTHNVEIPSLFSALFRFVRSNIMSVGIFATALAVGGMLLAQFLGLAEQGQRVSTMLVRGIVILAILPPSLIIGVLVARKQRATMRSRAIDSQRAKLVTFVERCGERALKRQLSAIQRSNDERATAWKSALKAWRRGEVEEAITRREKESAASIQDLRLAQQKLRDHIRDLRSLKGKLSDGLLFELKKQRRDLD